MTDEKIKLIILRFFAIKRCLEPTPEKIKNKIFNKILLWIMKQFYLSALQAIKVADRSYTIRICISKQSQAKKHHSHPKI